MLTRRILVIMLCSLLGAAIVAATTIHCVRRVDTQRRIAAIKRAIADGEDLDAILGNGFTRLHDAARGGRTEVAQFLLDNGADPNSRDFIGATPLHRAAQNGHTQVAALLIRNGADVNAAGSTSGDTPLMFAASFGGRTSWCRTRMIKVLLDAGAAVNARDQRGATALDDAAWRGYVDTARLLIEHGADVNAADTAGYSPIYTAASRGRIGVVELLLENGADVNIRTMSGETPLDIALRKAEFTKGMTHGKDSHRYASPRTYQKIADMLRAHGGKKRTDAL